MSASGSTLTHTLPVAEARGRTRAALIANGQPLPLHRVEDVWVPTPSEALRLRLFQPTEDKLPVALFFHGGGWTLNDVDTHDRLCRRIAKRSGWLVASLEYRRAPEHKHPAALEDAYVAYRWLLDNRARIGGDATRLALVGESSGGTMAANLTLLLREAGAPMPTYQILAYPATDIHGQWPSYRERGTGYTLDSDLMRWFMDNYLPETYDPEDQYLFPMAAQDLTGLPPTMVMTAEFDPLRDEGTAYAEKLAQAGVAVEHVHADDQMHGFLLLDRVVPRAGDLIDALADALAARASLTRTAA
jgi:acetyl esterase